MNQKISALFFVAVFAVAPTLIVQDAEPATEAAETSASEWPR